jgi:hypothetical protein
MSPSRPPNAHHMMIIPTRRRRLTHVVLTSVVLTVLAVLAGATPLQAQGPTRLVSINPFLPLAGSFQAEFETRVRNNLSVAVAGSYISFDGDDDRTTSADVKLRLYPSEHALEGFAIAAGVGVGRQSQLAYSECIGGRGDCNGRRRSATGPTFAVEMQYQWLLGKRRATAVTVGGGAKRFFLDQGSEGYPVYDEFRPTVRLTVGYAFR